MLSSQPLLDAAGRRRSPATTPGARAGIAPRNKGQTLAETDLDQRRGSILVRHGKNDRRREVGMDAWGWSGARAMAR